MKKILISSFVFLLIGCEKASDDLRDTSFAETTISPTNVAVDTQVYTDNSGKVIITPSAIGAVSFTVDKGDESPISTVDNGYSIENFYDTGEYTISVIAESLTGDKSNQVSTDIFVVSTCVEELEENIDSEVGNLLIENIDQYNSLFTSIGGISSTPVENPKADLTNISCLVEQVTMNSGCSTFAGLLLTFPNNYTISETSNIFSMNVFFTDRSFDVSVFFIGSENYEIVQTSDKLNQWETLNFDLSPYNGETLKRVILYFDKGEPCDDSVLYFDQIKLKS